MSRQTIVRLLFALLIVGTLSACASPTAPDGQGKPKDTLPWN